MQTIVFKRPTRIAAKTRQELAFWGELAGTNYRENTRYRFADEHAAKIMRNLKGIAVVVEEEDSIESDEPGVPATSRSTFTKEGEALEKAVAEGKTPAQALQAARS